MARFKNRTRIVRIFQPKLSAGDVFPRAINGCITNVGNTRRRIFQKTQSCCKIDLQIIRSVLVSYWSTALLLNIWRGNESLWKLQECRVSIP